MKDNSKVQSTTENVLGNAAVKVKLPVNEINRWFNAKRISLEAEADVKIFREFILCRHEK